MPWDPPIPFVIPIIRMPLPIFSMPILDSCPEPLDVSVIPLRIMPMLIPDFWSLFAMPLFVPAPLMDMLASPRPIPS